MLVYLETFSILYNLINNWVCLNKACIFVSIIIVSFLLIRSWHFSLCSESAAAVAVCAYKIYECEMTKIQLAFLKVNKQLTCNTFLGLPDPSQLFGNLPVDVMGIVRRTRGPRAVRYIKDENGVKYYMCEYCEYKCRSPGNLAKHVRRHTGEKPYLCPYCDYKAADRGSIKSHVRRHTGERPFQCSYCEYRSPYTSTLRAHMRKHTGEKPFFCTKCEYR